MNKYLVATCYSNAMEQEAIVALLYEIGFDSFEEKDTEIKAYIPYANDMDQVYVDLQTLSEKWNISIVTKILEPKNWNEDWEANFDPVVVDDKLFIRAPFHPNNSSYQYEIVISPKMAFGTGHHETTYLMLKYMMLLEFKNKSVLDHGSGTAILSIGASMMGAKNIVAVDIQPEAEDNAREHMRLNHIQNVQVITGTLEDVPDQKFDVILANINRNVIMDSLNEMKRRLNGNGQVLISGILKEDEILVLNRAMEVGLELKTKEQRGEWMCFHLLSAQ